MRGVVKAAATVAGVAAAAAVAFNAMRGDRDVEIELTPANPEDSDLGGTEMQATRSRRGGSLEEDEDGVQRGRGSRSSNGRDNGGTME